MCRKMLSCKSHLPLHRRTHTREKLYECECEQCRKMFSQKSYLTLQQRTHTAEKPYECEQYGKTFYGSHSKPHITELIQESNPMNVNDVGKHSPARDTSLNIRKLTGEQHYGCQQCKKLLQASTCYILENSLRRETT